METIFENKLTFTKEFYRECMGKVYLKLKSTSRFIIMAVVYFAVGVLMILLPSPDDNSTFYEWAIAGLGILIGILIFVRRRRLINVSYARHLEGNRGKERDGRMAITPDELHALSESGEALTHVDLNSIAEVIETKNYYTLVTKTSTLYSFAKSGFTKGTPEEFLAFLRSRGLRC